LPFAGASCSKAPLSVSFPFHRQDEDIVHVLSSFDFRAWEISFHSSALCRIRRNVRRAQLAFAAEPGNFNCSAQSPGVWSTFNLATDVSFSSRQLLRVKLPRFVFESRIANPIEKAIRKLVENKRFGRKWIGSFDHRSQFQAR
jgi:hypothetical protein